MAVLEGWKRAETRGCALRLVEGTDKELSLEVGRSRDKEQCSEESRRHRQEVVLGGR